MIKRLCGALDINLTFKFYKRSFHPNFRSYYDYNHYCERAAICYIARGSERENQ